MYARLGKLGRNSRMAGAHRFSGLRGLRGARLGDDDGGFDWSSITPIIQTGIQTAGQVAQVALKPPTYSSVVYPSGASTVQSYGALPSGAPGTATAAIGDLLASPYLVLGGIVLLAVILMKR